RPSPPPATAWCRGRRGSPPRPPGRPRCPPSGGPCPRRPSPPGPRRRSGRWPPARGPCGASPRSPAGRRPPAPAPSARRSPHRRSPRRGSRGRGRAGSSGTPHVRKTAGTRPRRRVVDRERDAVAALTECSPVTVVRRGRVLALAGTYVATTRICDERASPEGRVSWKDPLPRVRRFEGHAPPRRTRAPEGRVLGKDACPRKTRAPEAAKAGPPLGGAGRHRVACWVSQAAAPVRAGWAATMSDVPIPDRYADISGLAVNLARKLLAHTRSTIRGRTPPPRYTPPRAPSV